MAERVVDMYFVAPVKDVHVVKERSTSDLKTRFLWTKDRAYTVTHDGPYVRIQGTACTIKVPHANIAFMLVEDVADEPKKAGGK